MWQELDLKTLIRRIIHIQIVVESVFLAKRKKPYYGGSFKYHFTNSKLNPSITLCIWLNWNWVWDLKLVLTLTVIIPGVDNQKFDDTSKGNKRSSIHSNWSISDVGTREEIFDMKRENKILYIFKNSFAI